MRSVMMVLALGALAAPVQAGEVQVLGGVTLAFNLGDENSRRIEFNPHIEAEFRGFYGGIAADFYNGSINNEIKPYIGYRTMSAGGLSFDASYGRSILPNDGGDCCGAVEVDLGLLIGNRVTASLDMGLVPETGASDVTLGVDVAAFDKVILTAKAGVGGSDQIWELAAGYQLGDQTKVTAHYYDGSAVKPSIGLDLTWNFGPLGN